MIDSAMQTALAGDVFGLFIAVSIAHPLGTGRLLDGSAVLNFNSATWSGGSDVFGSLGALEVISDGSGDEAPAIKLSLLPPNAAQAVSLAVPSAQGGAVSVYVGAFSPTTGLVIGTPDLRFYGFIDTAVLVPDGERSMVVFDVISAFEEFFATEEGAKLSNSFHQSIWPAELGLQYLTSILEKMPWGTNDPLPPVLKS